MPIVVAALIQLALVLVMAVVGAIPVWLLWNWLMPDLFNLPALGFWQAFGLLVLTSLLFKSSGSSTELKS